MRLVLLGLPGAGKGTQGERISQKFGIPHISTGSIIRETIATGVGLAKQVDAHVSKGELIPDELVMQMVSERISKPDCLKGWILDGFPRTVAQAEVLDQYLEEMGSNVQMAFEIRITPQEAVDRIANRRTCRSCGAVYNLGNYHGEDPTICAVCGGELYRRTDDDGETALNRLKVYMKQTHPVVHYYNQDGRLYSVYGVRSIDEVFADVDHYLQALVDEQSVGEAQ